MKYPDVPNYVDGSFVGGDRPFPRRLQPERRQRHLARPAVARDEVDAAVSQRKSARFPAGPRTPIKERVQVFYRYKALLEQQHRRAGRAGHRGERQDRERSARRGSQVGRADASSRARCRRSRRAKCSR